MMMPSLRVELWIPGRWPTSNEALHLYEAAGFARARRARFARREPGMRGRSRVESERLALVLGVHAAVRRRGRGLLARALPVGARARLELELVGRRCDPSGAAVVAKWAEDGLVRAGVLLDDGQAHVAEVVLRASRDGEPGLRIWVSAAEC